MDEDDRLVEAIESFARALRALGTGNAATDMGAIEFLAIEVRNGLENVASALRDLDETLNDRLRR